MRRTTYLPEAEIGLVPRHLDPGPSRSHSSAESLTTAIGEYLTTADSSEAGEASQQGR
jgi:hypothetical protein